MSLRDFLSVLERSGELRRTRVPIDPALELTEVSTRALREGRPALLVERPGNSPYPLVVNHYASARRIELALGRHPDAIGAELIHFLERAVPPTLRTLLDNKHMLGRFLKARPARATRVPSQEEILAPDLDTLPVQTCWPDDGGRFITYGQVHTYDPRDGKRNIGLYRMHVFDAKTTGMHWQIQKGGGFHYFQAERLGRDLEVAVAIGTSPAVLFATIAALPEGIDEAMFAGFLQNKRVPYAPGRTVAIDVPADAEFVLEGVVPARERRMEGPFGDHFGHYSAASEFPVFHLRALTHRRNPVYPAIVVGKPPMEDKFLGDATQQILGPLAKLIHKEITNLWAYYEAGFHNLLVVAIDQRYQKEAVKAALGLMGTDQLSLTKCIVTVPMETDVRDWRAVVRAVRENFDPHEDFIMIPKVPLDTLDFTSYTMNLGSKMIVDATRKSGRAPRGAAPAVDLGRVRELDRRITDATVVDDTLLLVKLGGTLAATGGGGAGSAGMALVRKLVAMESLAGLRIAAVVSEDVDIHDKESYIWGVFTRFDCERDVLFTDSALHGISPVYRGLMGIDATWKPGYPKPLVMPEEIVRRVDEKWGRIWND